jgi:hypothetical protein
MQAGGAVMATVEQCRVALSEVAQRLAGDPQAGAKVDLDRSFACQIRDLGVSFQGRLANGTIVGLTETDDPRADIRMTVGSDDLLALVAGDLNFAKAWASGRLSVHASFRDLLKIRKLI